MIRYFTFGSKVTWSNMGPICWPMQKIQETWFQSLGRKDSLEQEMATYSSILAWKIPWTEESGGRQSLGSQNESGVTEHTHTMIM